MTGTSNRLAQDGGSANQGLEIMILQVVSFEALPQLSLETSCLVRLVINPCELLLRTSLNTLAPTDDEDEKIKAEKMDP